MCWIKNGHQIRRMPEPGLNPHCKGHGSLNYSLVSVLKLGNVRTEMRRRETEKCILKGVPLSVLALPLRLLPKVALLCSQSSISPVVKKQRMEAK